MPKVGNMRPARKEPDTATYSGRFAVRLRTLREKAGLSIAELADITGIHPKSLYDWEAGKPTFRLDVLPDLAEALGVKPRTLLPEK